MDSKEIQQTVAIGNLLKGKTIRGVRWMNQEEADGLGFYSKPMVILFTDGSLMYFQSDDEGNDGGAGIVLFPDGKELILYTR